MFLSLSAPVQSSARRLGEGGRDRFVSSRGYKSKKEKILTPDSVPYAYQLDTSICQGVRSGTWVWDVAD